MAEYLSGLEIKSVDYQMPGPTEEALANLQSQLTVLKIIIGFLIGQNCETNAIKDVENLKIFKTLTESKALRLLLDEQEIALALTIIRSAANLYLDEN